MLILLAWTMSYHVAAVPSLDVGITARNRGDLADAERAIAAVTKVDPQNASAWFELAVTQSWRERLDAALDSFRRAIELSPNWEAARLGEARVLAWLGHLDDARRIFRAALGRRPNSTEALNGLAMVQRLSLDRRGARNTYRRILQLDPGNVAAQRGIAQLEAVRPTELRVSLGGTSGASGALSFDGRVSASTRLDAQWDVDVEYSVMSAGDGLNGVVAGDIAAVHRGTLAMGWRNAVTRLRIGPSVQVTDETWSAGIDGSASLRLTDKLSGLAGLRLLWPTTLVSVGMVGVPTKGIELIAQYFVFFDIMPSTHAAVIRGIFSTGRLRFDLGGGPTLAPNMTFGTISAGGRWAVSNSTAIRVDAEYRTTPLDQLSARSSIEIAF